MPTDLSGVQWFKSSHSSAGSDCVELRISGPARSMSETRRVQAAVL